jgi:hypothetical protein
VIDESILDGAMAGKPVVDRSRNIPEEEAG